MKMLTSKKFISLIMTLVLVVAGVVNWVYNNSNNASTAKILGEAAYVNNNVTVEDSDSQNLLKATRETARDETKEMLQEIINNPNTTTDGRVKAEVELISLAKMIKNEVDCETILSRKGFKDVVVTISENTATVSVGIKNLMNTEIAQITETISSVTGLSAENIKILSGD